MKIPAEGLLASRLPTPAPSHPLREMAVAVSFLFTAAGPRRIYTGFPDATDRMVIYSINEARRKLVIYCPDCHSDYKPDDRQCPGAAQDDVIRKKIRS